MKSLISLRDRARLAAFVPVAILLCGSSPAWSTPLLGTAANFAVLGASTDTITGPTTVNGNLGVYPGTAITGVGGSLIITGTVDSADAVAQQAQTDATTAFNILGGLSPT